jgi:DNA-binding NarL/FixJ family response regulator
LALKLLSGCFLELHGTSTRFAADPQRRRLVLGVALVADDDAFFRSALRAILTAKLGYTEVIETGSLDEAIERLAEREDVSLALFDLAMPGMESAASLRAVREHFPDLRVAMVSASQLRTDILTALEAGVHGYVPKSLGVSELPRALQMIMDGIIYVPPRIADLPPRSERDSCRSRVQRPGEEPASNGVTPRQRDVLGFLVKGKSNKEIARALNLGEGTVKIHMSALFRSLGVNSRSAAAVAGAKLLQSGG